MRNTLIALLVLLVLWITGSSYWYVCRIRCDCKAGEPVETGYSEDITVSPDQQMQDQVNQAGTYLVNSGIKKVFFESSSAIADINVISGEYIEKLKLFLENNPEAKVSVSGHTDSSGPESGNIILSRKRTEFVKDFLINSGINANQIQTFSKVDTEPAASNETPEGRAQNRRTEIQLLN